MVTVSILAQSADVRRMSPPRSWQETAFQIRQAVAQSIEGDGPDSVSVLLLTVGKAQNAPRVTVLVHSSADLVDQAWPDLCRSVTAILANALHDSAGASARISSNRTAGPENQNYIDVVAVAAKIYSNSILTA